MLIVKATVLIFVAKLLYNYNDLRHDMNRSVEILQVNIVNPVIHSLDSNKSYY